MPEPESAFYIYAPDTAVIMPKDLADPEGEGGKLALRQFADNRYLLVRMDGEASGLGLDNSIPSGRDLAGIWIRLDSRPQEGPTGAQVLSWLRKAVPKAIPPHPVPPKLRKKRQLKHLSRQVIGLTFPEEATPDGDTRNGWIFLCVDWAAHGFLMEGQVTSPSERSVRIPDLVQLKDRSVVVLGVGSLGGDTAVHLARAGTGHLHLLDHDRFEVNNAVRHVLDTHDVGLNKAEAVAKACERANPFSSLSFDGQIRFGVVTREPPQPLERLFEVVGGSDLVVETTGSTQIQLLAGRVAWDLGKPFVSCWLTEASWAGHVVRLVRGKTACPVCFATRALGNELLEGDAGPEDPAFPQGCSHPTTTGAGFEAIEVVANTVRLIAGMLTLYPAPRWDHAVLNFRRSPDDSERPRFQAENLERTEDCESCNCGAG